jgi:hypothetical protein
MSRYLVLQILLKVLYLLSVHNTEQNNLHLIIHSDSPQSPILSVITKHLSHTYRVDNESQILPQSPILLTKRNTHITIQKEHN